MKEKFKEFLNNTDRVDLKMILAIVLLCAFGCMMVYSASSYVCATSKDFQYDGAYLLKRQLAFSVLGFAAMLGVQFIDYHVLYWINWKVYVIAVVMILLLKTPLGVKVNGAVRWLEIGGITIHVGEVTKILLILFLAYMMSQHPKGAEKYRSMFVLWFYAVILAGMILEISSNLSTCLIMIMTTYGMTFIWSKKTKCHLIMGVAAVALVALLLLYLYQNLPTLEEAPNVDNYQLKRIYIWMDPEKYKDVFSDQVLQSLYAVGSGGFFGKGLGKSAQKISRIPEPQNDMIFAIICEELGIFGGMIVLLLLGYLILQLVRVAMSAQDMYGGLLVTGIVFHLSFQTIVNVAVALNVFPNTGVSLPFISYGGSSMVLMLGEIGIALSVRRYRVLRDFEKEIKQSRQSSGGKLR